MIAQFCQWLAVTKLSVAIQSAAWIVPATQTLHILLIATVMASVVLFTLRGANASPYALRGLWVALPGLILTGAILIIAEPARELLNPIFLLKMLILVGACAITLATRRFPRFSLVLRPVSVLLWVAVVVAGRWIAYLQVLS
jgi:hypothetical protein